MQDDDQAGCFPDAPWSRAYFDWGQAYRLYGTVGFGAMALGQMALGF